MVWHVLPSEHQVDPQRMACIGLNDIFFQMNTIVFWLKFYSNESIKFQLTIYSILVHTISIKKQHNFNEEIKVLPANRICSIYCYVIVCQGAYPFFVNLQIVWSIWKFATMQTKYLPLQSFATNPKFRIVISSLCEHRIRYYLFDWRSTALMVKLSLKHRSTSRYNSGIS